MVTGICVAFFVNDHYQKKREKEEKENEKKR